MHGVTDAWEGHHDDPCCHIRRTNPLLRQELDTIRALPERRHRDRVPAPPADPR